MTRMNTNKFYSVILLLLILQIKTFGQDFINGDLEGIITGPSCLPAGWQNVPVGDINCLASCPGGDSPDLLDSNMFWPSAGFNGNPFSGQTFIGGAMIEVPLGTNCFAHEGILQIISGLTSNKVYCIRFRQAVIKYSGCIDPSGSWAIFIDTLLAGISTPSYNPEPYDSTNVTWDARKLTFMAMDTIHTIKFLPMDDDTNYSVSDSSGGIYMGIDSIGLELVTGIEEVSEEINFSLFPNPVKGILNISGNQALNELEIFNLQGQFIERINTISTSNYQLPVAHYSNGVYLFKLTTKFGVVNKRVVIMN
jgi:hypothetical protein